MQRAAVEEGMRTLREDGWLKVLSGRTTVDEVVRVTKANEGIKHAKAEAAKPSEAK
jgi:hypothetical protein